MPRPRGQPSSTPGRPARCPLSPPTRSTSAPSTTTAPSRLRRHVPSTQVGSWLSVRLTAISPGARRRPRALLAERAPALRSSPALRSRRPCSRPARNRSATREPTPSADACAGNAAGRADRTHRRRQPAAEGRARPTAARIDEMQIDRRRLVPLPARRTASRSVPMAPPRVTMPSACSPRRRVSPRVPARHFAGTVGAPQSQSAASPRRGAHRLQHAERPAPSFSVPTATPRPPRCTAWRRRPARGCCPSPLRIATLDRPANRLAVRLRTRGGERHRAGDRRCDQGPEGADALGGLSIRRSRGGRRQSPVLPRCPTPPRSPTRSSTVTRSAPTTRSRRRYAAASSSPTTRTARSTRSLARPQLLRARPRHRPPRRERRRDRRADRRIPHESTGVLSPTQRALVTGYDFLADGSEHVVDTSLTTAGRRHLSTRSTSPACRAAGMDSRRTCRRRSSTEPGDRRAQRPLLAVPDCCRRRATPRRHRRTCSTSSPVAQRADLPPGDPC